MNIYISSVLIHSKKAEQIAEELEDRGHIVPFKWWEKIGDLTVEESRDLATSKYLAILQCETFILIPSECEGSDFELGVAFHANKKIFALKECEGWGESIFHYLPGINEVKEEELYEILENISTI